MKSKFKVIFFISTLVISLFMGKASVSSDLSWYIGTTKSELWAIAQKLNRVPISQLINSNSLGFSQAPKPSTSEKNMEIASNAAEFLSYNFPLGWYDSVDNLETPAKIANEGINVVVPYTGKSSVREVKAYLDRSAAAGIKVMVEIPRDAVKRANKEQVVRFVRELKTHPATYGWYLYDEPDFVQLSPRILEKVYQAIKAEDSIHPVGIAFNKLMRISKYLKAVDIVMYFNYPCNYNEPEFSGFQESIFPKLAQSVALVTQNKSHFWFIAQGYGEDKYGKPTKFKKRLPTAAEQKYMVYSAILAQADGLLFWSHYLSQQNWIDSVLLPIVQEVKEYLPAIKALTLENKLAIDNFQIQGNLYRNPTDNSLLLIAINHGNSKVETAIAIPENSYAASAKVLKENRSLNFERGTLKDTFEPYSVHIYQIEPA